MGETLKLTYRQLEEMLSQNVRAMYLTQLGHQPRQVACKLVDKTITIFIQGSITKVEELLVKNGKQQLAELVRLQLQKTLQPHLKLLVEEACTVPVIDVLSDSSNTGNTSIVAILAATPLAQNFSSPTPVKPEKELGEDDDK